MFPASSTENFLSFGILKKILSFNYNASKYFNKQNYAFLKFIL